MPQPATLRLLDPGHADPRENPTTPPADMVAQFAARYTNVASHRTAVSPSRGRAHTGHGPGLWRPPGGAVSVDP
jgi:hypothetical protein